MCTTWSTRNRAVIVNNYSVRTLLVDSKAYCPCGPDRQDYRKRSRIYNPDPKYQCHSDLTCHTFDSIPKDMSCGGYGAPTQSTTGNNLPCFSNGPCFPQNDSCGGGNNSGPSPPPRCVRRVRRPPACNPARSSYRDFICSMECCCPCPCPCPCPPPPCCSEEDNGQEDGCDEEQNKNDGGYSVELPKDACGSKVIYNIDPCGQVCRQVDNCGNRVQMPCTNGVLLETSGGSGSCGDCCVNVQSICSSPPCCPTICCPSPPSPSGPPCCPSPCCEPCCDPSLCSNLCRLGYCPLPSPTGMPSPCCPPFCAPPCCPTPPLKCPLPCGPCPPRCRVICCPQPCCPSKKKSLRCSSKNACGKTTVGNTYGCGCCCMECRPRFRNP